jgi:hypothetical protein
LGCRRRQDAGVYVTVDRQRETVDLDDRGRDHIGRQQLGQCGAHPGRVHPARRRGEVAHQPPVAGAVLAGGHHRLVHPVQRDKGGLDNAEVDAIALHIAANPDGLRA